MDLCTAQPIRVIRDRVFQSHQMWEDGAWVTPFEQDPQVPNTIYAAFLQMYGKQAIMGATWEKHI
ncbi:MAG: hypothetical protein R2778_03155 [Saprospiraceae bacterium]